MWLSPTHPLLTPNQDRSKPTIQPGSGSDQRRRLQWLALAQRSGCGRPSTHRPPIRISGCDEMPWYHHWDSSAAPLQPPIQHSPPRRPPAEGSQRHTPTTQLVLPEGPAPPPPPDTTRVRRAQSAEDAQTLTTGWATLQDHHHSALLSAVGQSPRSQQKAPSDTQYAQPISSVDLTDAQSIRALVHGIVTGIDRSRLLCGRKSQHGCTCEVIGV
jgi:hypothetical protein